MSTYLTELLEAHEALLAKYRYLPREAQVEMEDELVWLEDQIALTKAEEELYEH